MEPTYFAENRYSYVVNALPHLAHNTYEVESPESKFERDVQSQLATANALLMNQKYGAALEKYLYIRGLISAVLYPKISVVTAIKVDWATIGIHKLTDNVLSKSVELLKKTPVGETTIPKAFRTNINTALDNDIVKFEKAGFTDGGNNVGILVDEALTLIEKNEFAAALPVFTQAMEATTDPAIKPALLHDIAIVQERLGKKPEALEAMKKSAAGFEAANDREYQAKAINALAGIQLRNNDRDGAAASIKQAKELRTKFNLFTVLTGVRETKVSLPSTKGIQQLASLQVNGGTGLAGIATSVLTRPQEAAAVTDIDEPVQLLSYTKFAGRQAQKQLGVLNKDGSVAAIALGAQGDANLTNFYKQIQTSKDPAFLMGYLWHHTTTIAYLTHIYSWVLPMAIGDCHEALGSYQEAEKEYLSTLNYKYLNTILESVNLWIRLAELYNEWGDRLYRNAGRNIPEFKKAAEKYELLIKANNTIDNNSSLYKHASFASMKTRANAVIQTMVVTQGNSNENPRMIEAILHAKMQLTKIGANLNFLGISVDVPPFSFEYLQTVARYFCQHAGQVEQMYIQFMSTAENEKLREQQMAQQVSLSAASVELEQRAVTEAREGLDVANASFNYANVQLNNANAALTSFNNVRWELLELDTLTAWANASAVDRDDQVKLTISNYSYYNTESTRRNVVLKELAEQRTRISHQLEAERLQREIAEAQAYRNVSQQQIQQAQARVEVARQRVVIAKTQERFARENLEFLQGREFNSAMWYNLSRAARRFAGKYIDMAIEAAIMMEIAYEAETGRELHKIKFEYGLTNVNGLMAAESLMTDIDYFTIDYLRTRSRKAQMKQSISLADNFPMAFSKLLDSGETFFETTLNYFDRRYPGYYLQKIKQVEVVLIGLNGTEGVHGTLRNVGISKFRKKNGTIINQMYTADVLPMSEYSVKNDAIVFQLDTRELRLFENNGIATKWQLNLPLSTNTFPLRQILDVQLVIYYDGFFDPQLESQIKATLPANGTASRGISLQLFAPDELFFLKNQGNAVLNIEPSMFPANQKNHILTSYFIKAVGDATTVANLKLRIKLEGLNQGATLTLGADGTINSAPFPAPLNKNLFDKWNITIDAADNPQLVQDGKLNLRGLRDISIFTEYKFDYR